MSTITIRDKKGKETTRHFLLNTEVFEDSTSTEQLRQSIHVHQQNTRTGSAKAKNRAEVSGTGKKPWANNKQSRARTGDKQTPIFVGGGVSHGPVPMNYGKKMMKTMQAHAFAHALIDKVKEERLFIIEDGALSSMKKTNEAWEFLRDLYTETDARFSKSLVCIGEYNETIARIFRNIPRVRVLSLAHTGPYDVAEASVLIMTESAMSYINGDKATEKSETKTKSSRTKKEPTSSDDA